MDVPWPGRGNRAKSMGERKEGGMVKEIPWLSKHNHASGIGCGGSRGHEGVLTSARPGMIQPRLRAR